MTTTPYFHSGSFLALVDDPENFMLIILNCELRFKMQFTFELQKTNCFPKQQKKHRLLKAGPKIC